MTAGPVRQGPTRPRRDAAGAFARAWTAVALVPVFFFIAFAVGEGMQALLGYAPENGDAPVWATLVALTPVVIVVLIPCAAAVFFGRTAARDGDRRGLVPLVIGVIAGAAVLLLTIITEVGNAVRR